MHPGSLAFEGRDNGNSPLLVKGLARVANTSQRRGAWRFLPNRGWWEREKEGNVLNKRVRPKASKQGKQEASIRSVMWREKREQETFLFLLFPSSLSFTGLNPCPDEVLEWQT